jgi:hypothetical protein
MVMKIVRLFPLIALLMAATGLIAQAQTVMEKAKVVDAFGTAKRRNSDSAPWQNINVGDLLPTQTTVQTGDNSAVLLQLPDRHIFRIGAASTVQLKQLGKDKEFSFSVLSGHVWSFVRRAEKPAKYEIETPSAVIGVSGTVFSVSHDPNSADTEVSTDKGEVNVSAGGATQIVATGYTLRARRGLALARAVVQTQAQRHVWQALHAHEKWLGGASSGRLDRRIEQTYIPFRRNADVGHTPHVRLNRRVPRRRHP